MIYVIIDVMEKKVYCYEDSIEMGFALDSITRVRDYLDIPYRVNSYNNGQILAIRNR